VVSVANEETIARLGVERVGALIGDIHRDRDETYRALGEEP
jgi:hypothetical protein